MPFNPQPKPERKAKKVKQPIKQVSDKKAKEIKESKTWPIDKFLSEQKKIKTLKSKIRKMEKETCVSTPLIRIKKDFDVIYSLVVKMQPANSDGVVQCYCGQRLHWSNANNSHFIPRSTAPSLIHERMNTHPSCVPCNGFKEGNRNAYIPWMNKKYGVDAVTLLEYRANKKSNNGVFEYTVMMYEYINLFAIECKRLHHTPTIGQRRIIKKYSTQ